MQSNFSAKHFISVIARRYIAMALSLLLVSLLPYNLQAQILLNPGPIPVSIPPGEYYHPSSITLAPGFYFIASPEHKIRFFIKPVVLLTQLSTSQNYIVTYTTREGNITSPSNSTLTANQVMTTVQYFDGLGRPLQTVQVKGNGEGTGDLVQPFAYDQFGREAKKYLPYTTGSGNAGSYRADALTGVQQAFYHPGGSGSSGDQLGGAVVRIPTPFATTVYESSPLNRLLEQGAPGNPWQPLDPNISGSGHTVKVEYGSNNNADVAHTVKFYNADTLTAGLKHLRSLSSPGNYPANALYLTVTKDENWIDADDLAGKLFEYKDKEGRVVLKRTFNRKSNSSIETLSTYYVYDDLGNLSFVLPPGTRPDSTVIPNQSRMDNFGYQYRYDGRKRLIEKRLPGKGDWEEMIYNKLDQVVFTQDANQKGRSERSWIKYDALGRVIMSGIESGDTLSRQQVQQIVDNQTGHLWEVPDNTEFNGYSNTSVPTNLPTIKALLVNYYDGYSILSAPSSNPTTTNPDPAIFTPPAGAQSTSIKGLSTVSKVNILGTDNYLWTVNYFDDEGRVIQSKSQNHMGGTDVVNNTYSFTDELLTSTRTHKVGTSTTTIGMAYTYDHMGRKTQTTESINGATPTVLSQLAYNEVGQLKEKQLGGGLQTVSYTYNERGWMKSANTNGNLFNMQLKYNDAVNGIQPQYNGNIANQVFTNGTSNTFNYTYDKLNRLTSGAATGMSEQLTYDVMGNIKSLSRDGGAAGIYNYSGNQLTQITGGPLATASYVYDGNGNATTDGRLSKTITYNLLNLPQSISGGPSYTYTASGQKLKKVSGNVTTHYIGGIQYTNNDIDLIQTEEGLALKSGTAYSYRYNVQDHLGNTRATLYLNPANNQVEAIQRDDYYAFGLQKSSLASTNKYLYNGKELQDELNQYDYGARFYDPVIARWTSVDPSAERAVSLTPFRYGFNNPVRMVDPNGRYETDGHFWTVYLMATMMGSNNAFNIAYATEAPDNIMNRNGDVISSPSTWLNPISQYWVHALNGHSSDVTRMYAVRQVASASDVNELGTALHYLGDSYAHSKIGNEGTMYQQGVGHLKHGHNPDYIAKRPELYRSYVGSLTSALGSQLGFNGKLDTFTFDYVAGSGGSTEQNSAILETEVRFLQGGANAFTVKGDQVNALNDYMNSRNSHYNSKFSLKATAAPVTTYRRNDLGAWTSYTETITTVGFNR